MRKGNYQKAELRANNDIYEGQSIEEYCRKAEATKTPVETVAPEIYTARKDGVLPQYDPRTDRWELAQAAMDKMAASIQARRSEYVKSMNGNTTEDDTKNEESAKTTA